MDFDKIYNHAKYLLERYGKTDKSSYTDNRKILWIEKQPLFTRVAEIPAHQDEFIKAIANEIEPNNDYILIAGGNTEIEMHRDARYANRQATTINLGGEAHFEYEGIGGTRLKHGDITKFDCKRLHGILEADLNRIVIGIWSKNPNWR